MSSYFFIPKKPFSSAQTEVLKSQLPKQTIISIYGMAGVGKGTLSAALSESLGIPTLDTGKIWRAITYIYTTLNWEISQENSDKVVEMLEVFVQNQQLAFRFGEKTLGHSDLKNSFIDSKVASFSQDYYTHQRFFDKCVQVYRSLSGETFVRDGRGATTVDLDRIEAEGFQIVRIMVDCSDEIKWQRYYQNVFYNKRANNSNLEDGPEMREKLRQEFAVHILERNLKDQESQQKLGNKLISDDSAILDNGQMTVQEMLESTLAYLAKRLGKK